MSKLIGLRAKSTASSLERSANCPGWVALADSVDLIDSKESREGTALHEESAKILINRAYKDKGFIYPNDSVKNYVETVLRLVPERAYKKENFFIEQRLPFCGTSGQIDFYVLNPYEKEAYLFDAKFGIGVKVYAKDNYQLAGYSVALRIKHPFIKKIAATIIQPRVMGVFEETFHSDTWYLQHQNIDKWKRVIERILDRIEIADKIKVGPWCQFCPATTYCNLYKIRLEKVRNISRDLEIEEVLRAFSGRKMVQKWFDKTERFLLSLVTNGGISKEDLALVGVELAQRKNGELYLKFER